MAKFLPLVLVVLSLIGAPARAQTSTETAATAAPVSATTRVDNAKSTVDQVQSILSRSEELDDTTLANLRAEVGTIATQMAAVVTEITPQIDAAKAQLAQLGPKPGSKDPPEPAPVSAERASQEQLFGNLDAISKRAKVLGVQARQITDTIDSQARARFAHALFRRYSSLLDPNLWVAVGKELPADYNDISTLSTDWATASWNRLSHWQRSTFGGLLLLIALAYWPIWRIACRIRHRGEDDQPSRLRKAMAALRVAIATAAVPTLAVLAVGGLVLVFELPSQFAPAGQALTLGVAVVAVMTGLMRGILAPKSPNWRLVPLPDEATKILYHLTISVTSVVAVTRVVEAVNDIIGVDLHTTGVATRGLGALGVILAMLVQTRKGIKARRAARDIARSAQTEHWIAIIRLIGWTLILILIAAIVTGYTAFAAFMVEQIIAVAGTLALLYLLLAVTDEGVAALFNPKSRFGRALSATLGLRADTFDQIVILLSGFSKITLYLAAVLLVLAPWRIESGDMLATVEAAFFGFSVGDVTISLSTIIVAVALFAVVMGTTRALQRWLEVTYLPHTKLDIGLQNSIKTSLGYVGAIIALGVSLGHMGLSFERLTLIAGGLSVGIGLGLQTITNNFVSGLILLWERAVRVGDRITVGADEGYVRRINVRSTEIETFDRALVVMPNSSLITGVVKNWVRNDRVGRISLPFVLPLTADPETIRSVLIKAGKSHDLVLAIPSPQVFFKVMTDTQIHLDLVCYVEDVESSIRVTSDLLFAIYGRFKELGLVAPAAPAVVTSPALDKLDAWLSAKAGGVTL